MRAKEAEGEQQHADNHQCDGFEQRQRDARQHQHNHRPQHFATAQLVRQCANLRRTVNARQVHHREQADHGLVHVVRVSQQAITDVVEQRHKAAHQQKCFEKQPRQTGVTKVHGEAVQQAARVHGLRAEVTRFRQDLYKHHGQHQRQAANHQHRCVPADKVDQHAGDQTPAHPANRIAADVQPHRQANVLRVDFLAQVGHSNGGQPAQRQAHQCAGNQYAFPARHPRTEHSEQRRAEQRRDHHRLTPDGIRNRPRHQQTDSQHPGGHRQNQTALRGVDPVFMGQHRHHRLHAIQQGKRRKAPREQCQHRAHEHRRAFLDKDVFELSDNIIQRRGRDFMSERGDSSFHGDLITRIAKRQWQKNIAS